jgi:hypothetical protein
MTVTIGKPALALALAVFLVPAAASAADEPREERHSQTLRSFVLRNRSDQPITEAHAYTTQHKDKALTTDGPIQPLRSQEFMVEQTECIDRVTAKLQNGRTLDLDNMQNCRNPTIVVDNEGISIETSATGTPMQSAPRDTQPPRR